MQFDLSHIRKAEDHFERTFRPADLPQDGEAYRVLESVHLAFVVQKDKARFRLVGTVRTGLELECSRCLEAFRMPVDAAFDQRYMPRSEASDDAEAEVAADDLATSYYEDEQIDLNELLREQFYLVLPMKPLCAEDCKGLCPHCGTNLNAATCACAPAWEDPRLAPLKKLM